MCSRFWITEASNIEHMLPITFQRLLSDREVANTCAISVATLRKWRSQGRGPRFLKIGALVRYRPDDISAWIDHQTAVGGNKTEVVR